MTGIVYNYKDIGEREARIPAVYVAAFKTLEALGYTYMDGAELWKPPLGKPNETIADLGHGSLRDWLNKNGAL